MRARFLLTSALSFCLISPAMAGSFESELPRFVDAALRTNPSIAASENTVALAAEAVTFAATGYKPTVAATASANAAYSDTDPGGSHTRTPVTLGISADQPLYRGGRTAASIDQAQNNLEAARLAHQSVVAQVAQNTATALLDVAQAQAVKALNENDIKVLERQFDATSRTFEVGELTRTDVAQAKAQLEGAKANAQTAEANLAEATARLKSLSGLDAGGKKIELPTAEGVEAALPNLTPLPETAEAAGEAAATGNLLVQSAKMSIEAADRAIRVAEGALLPSVDLVASGGQTWKPAGSTTLDQSRSASVGVSATIPLYTAGTAQSAIRSAIISKAKSKDSAADLANTAAAQAKTVWEQNRAARARIAALKAKVDADTQARDGTYREREVGTRTVLDTLNADQALLNSQTSLVGAVHDALATRFAVLNTIGKLSFDVSALDTPTLATPAKDTPESGVIVEPLKPQVTPMPAAEKPVQTTASAAPVILSRPERFALDQK